MIGRAILFTCAGVVVGLTCARAALIVDPPRSITHRVSVQIIETALDNGTSPATIFGNATQRSAIEAGIDSIWAQSGIDIAFLPTITRYNNTFAYQGSGGSRPSSDLGRILSAAGTVMNPDPYVINMFFVNIVPGFAFTSENTANGIGNVGGDGIAQFVGDNLLTFANGRDVIAGVVAHEIGHNLGLNHTATGGANLMSPQGTTAQLTSSQFNTVFQSSFPRLIPIVIDLPGDYNRDGIVNTADYVVWRNSLGSTANLAADGNSNGTVDSGDYTFWRSRYGTSRGVGAGAEGLSQLIPEPPMLAYAAAAIAFFSFCRPRRPT